MVKVLVDVANPKAKAKMVVKAKVRVNDLLARARVKVTKVKAEEKVKAKVKEKAKEKEKEKEIKEKEKEKFMRPRAVNHSLQPKLGKDRKPRETNNNNIMIKIGPKIIGGQTVMPPQNNHNGAKIVAGLRITMIGLPRATQIVSYPGWNPGTPLTSAKILST